MIYLARLHGLLIVLLLSACASPGVKLTADKHVSEANNAVIAPPQIPPVAMRSFSLPAPKAQPKPETYSVVVSNVKVQDLLFALSRDAKVNIDIHPGLSGNVTLNALDQTLPQLLTRIAKQVDLRFELDGPNLVVMPDTPYLRNYKIDYVNLSRDTSSTISVASQIGSAVSTGTDGNTSQNQTQGSGSSARIQNSSRNRFWDSLIQNVKDLLRETDKVLPEGSLERTVQVETQGSSTQQETRKSKAEAVSRTGGDTASTAATTEKVVTFREAASVIANIETGVLTVRATSRQQEKVQEFLDRVMASAKRQVLIEATIAEVQLTQNYQQGIDWSALNVFDSGFNIIQKAAGAITGTAPSSLLELASNGQQFTSSIRLLESFGTVKVLSSPKLSVLNNQTAVMKVVDDNIYFTYEIKETDASTVGPAKTTITSTLHSVPVGLVLTITPQVGEDDSVTLNIRPSLSRVIGQKTDPSLQLMSKTTTTITNTIPIIRAREFDSVMRINNGNIAVMGGLMEDALNNTDDSVPGISNTKLIGGLFQNRNDTKSKTELVIFVRPTIIRSPSLEGDYRSFATQVPTEQFFDGNAGPAIPRLPEAKP
ncbi:type II and III secretion system protein [Uliginosibacterium sp. 31-16]|uniref:type II secretion system protein GspD n=1 Tax=Uliginosibacterium sp. 31-16 TaxID=3068315 RepID=UPI00273F0B60|nr:type II and III secretion system protein [Uliginosibacterium sp. 31-16]MDP5241219.1 type II and III secretion system protein [Uliginosibacterium sp. 31-16]